jgi:hypothetical protein
MKTSSALKLLCTAYCLKLVTCSKA